MAVVLCQIVESLPTAQGSSGTAVGVASPNGVTPVGGVELGAAEGEPGPHAVTPSRREDRECQGTEARRSVHAATMGCGVNSSSGAGPGSSRIVRSGEK